MQGYCYECRKEAKEEVCDECSGIALPVLPRNHEGAARHCAGGGVGIALLPNELGSPDKLFSCELKLDLPAGWDARDLREVGESTDLFMRYRQCEMSWRYDPASGRLRLMGRRSEGRCEWCLAFRKGLQNMAREEGRSFRNDGACLTV